MSSRPLTLQRGIGTSSFGSVSTATQILAQNTSRNYLYISTTGTIYITLDGTTPTATNGFQVTASAPLQFETSFVPTGIVTAFASTSTPYSILWA
jgi:hypothetical protein